MRPAELVRRSADYLARHGVQSPRETAEALLMHLLATDRAGLYAQAEGLDTRTAKLFGRALCQRCSGTPLQYLTGEQAFLGLTLLVSPGVFVPRPETEGLVEAALEVLDGQTHPLVVDVGTGTGAIALAIKARRPDARVVATDLSEAAVTLARSNATRHGLAVDVRLGDLMAAVPVDLRGYVDLLVSNPPYISAQVYLDLAQEVKAEPYEALVGGTQLHARLVAAAGEWLSPGGWLAVEIGDDQGPEVHALFQSQLAQVQVVPDLAGRDRVVLGDADRDVGGPAEVPMSQVFEVDPSTPEGAGAAVEAAALALTHGLLVVLPTETVYGVACRPDDADATRRLFAAKRRPAGLSLPVLAGSAEDAWDVVVPTVVARRVAAAFWPGPLTMVLPRTDRSRTWKLGTAPDTVGVRVPDHPLMAALLARVGPLAATSANPSGVPPLERPGALIDAFGEAVAVYLVVAEGSRQPAGMSSTVVDLTGAGPELRRRGPVSLDALLSVAGNRPGPEGSR